MRGFPSEFCNYLAKFLSSFSGLDYLSVLLNDAATVSAASCSTATYGKTLKILAWEGRRGRKSMLERDTSLFSYDTPEIHVASRPAITKENVNLEEFGFAYDWGSGGGMENERYK